MKQPMEAYTMLSFCISLLSILSVSNAVDTITATQSIRDGGHTIVSAGGTFELGFFSSVDSTRRYLGIWYKKIPISTVVWVANTETPLLDSSGVVNVTNKGVLTLLDSNKSTIWSSNSSRFAQNPVVQILDSGNLVIKDGNDNDPENFIWQSFDHPSDTLLPGMKLGGNTVTGQYQYLTSWKNNDDPSPGEYTCRLEPQGFPQLIVREGLVERYRSGPWNGLHFSGAPILKSNQIYSFHFVFNSTEAYYTYELLNSSVVMRMVLNQNGIMQRFIWSDRNQDWVLYITSQTDICESYAFCGAYGNCNADNSPVCGCLQGFVPKFPKDWASGNWTNGCVRRTPLNCRSGDGFLKYSGLKLPDTRSSLFNESMSLEECKMMCLKNCSCMACSHLDISGEESGCLLWFGDLIDIREYSDNGQDIYIKLASSEIGQDGSNRKKRVLIIIILVLFPGMLLLGIGLSLLVRKKRKQYREGRRECSLERIYTIERHEEDLELPLFDFATIANATNDFSIDNKLGEGGFGPVYKGVLEEGQEIAVKRLSINSKQGLDEFKNEVLCIAKLQHRNLVKLLGCCIQEEKMLIYEYMPNKSLDFFIFDETGSKLLNWLKRFHIIKGIARGLLYLHQDSRLRIIHRDLKASNILLDYEMNPKISDFGLARIFGGNETEASTNRVVGTFGYISPEYAADGLFSIKSDVFSFGVLVLEIVSGKRNSGFYHPDHDLNLLGHAWGLYKGGRCLEMIDASMGNSCNLFEVLRSIHVGLLCVQQFPEDRPNMSSVVLMLNSEIALPQPKQPGFFAERDLLEAEPSSRESELCSANELLHCQPLDEVHM